MTTAEIDREVRAIFNNFARQFKDLPGDSAIEKASSFTARYVSAYHHGYRATDGLL